MKKKIILLLVIVVLCSGCGKSTDQSNNNQSGGSQNNNMQESGGSDISQSGVYHYSEDEITPNRKLESGEIILKIGNKEFNILDLTFGKILNNFNSSVGLYAINIMDKENFDPNVSTIFQQFKEEKTKILITMPNDNEDIEDNTKENFLHRIIQEISISASDTTLNDNFPTGISVQGISIGMTRDEVLSILGEPSTASSLRGDFWYVEYRYTDTKVGRNERCSLNVVYNDNNQVIRLYVS